MIPGLEHETAMLTDLRHALRLLTTRPAFSLAAISTLAIGIGGASAMFGVLDAVLLRPLPFRDPPSLVMVWERNPGFTDGDVPASPGDFIAWHRVGAFDRLSALTFSSYTLTVHGEPQRVSGAIVTPGFFDLLGVVPAAGRAFTSDDARAQQSAVMLSPALASQLGITGDPAGRAVTMNDRDVRVVGVLPGSFSFPGVSADVWLLRDLPPGSEKNVGGHSLTVVGRLKAGRSVDSAQAELGAFVRALNEGGPNAAWTAALVPMAREGLSATTVRALPILFGAVGLLLVIACANVAGLLLVRTVGRQREFAIRAAVGATAWRLARQALVESLVFAAIAGGAGLLLAGWLLLAARTLGPAGLVRLDTASVDLRVTAFAVLLSFVTGALTALAPVLRTRRPGVGLVLASGGRGASSNRAAGRVRAAIVAAEVAVALVLAVGATLLVRSYLAVRSVDPGIRVDHVLTMRVALPFARYADAATRRAFFDDVLARVGQVDGVSAAALTDNLPLSGNSLFYFIEVGGLAPPGPGEPLYQADTRTVSATYFSALSLSVVKGRAFDEHDTATSEPVAIVMRLPSRFGTVDSKRPVISSSRAPSKTGVATLVPGATWSASIACRRRAHSSPMPETSQPCLASQPRWISSTCPGFIRDGTPSGLRMMSTGVPSSRNGMSSTGRILEMTTLLPWRPASLSPSVIFRFCATYTRTSSFTPGGSSSPSSRSKTRTPMTLPTSPCGTFREVSRTSRAFSPKIARSSRSSGVSSVSPFGVTLPTRMSPATTSAPIRMMPRSSRSARTSSETFGMSRVISSGPSLVSRASTSCSSMWIEDSTSSCTRRCDRMIASS